MGGGSVTLDADEYLKLLDELSKTLGELRELGKNGFSSVKPKLVNKPKENDQSAMVIDLDISGIQWMTKGKQPAGPTTGWCWAFSETKDGGVIRETMQLLQAVEQYGTVQCGKYLINLGGRDNNLLNRRIK